MARKTQAQWKEQAKVRKTHLTIHYLYDARLSIPSMHKGYSSDEFNARGNAYKRIGQEYYNKAVIVNERTGKEICILRRDPKTGHIEVKDIRYETLLGK